MMQHCFCWLYAIGFIHAFHDIHYSQAGLVEYRTPLITGLSAAFDHSKIMLFDDQSKGLQRTFWVSKALAVFVYRCFNSYSASHTPATLIDAADSVSVV